MVKYINELVTALKSRLAGMKTYTSQWANQPVTVEELEGIVNQLDNAEIRIDSATSELEQAREEGRKLADMAGLKLKKIDSLADGIHAEEPTMLSSYGISTRKDRTTKPIPGKGIISSIEIDTDGIGFVITIQKLSDADHYQIERGVSANSSDTVLAPPFPFLKTTTKTTVVDDDVVKGSRYFYRIRGVNANGTGEWSESVNKVQ